MFVCIINHNVSWFNYSFSVICKLLTNKADVNFAKIICLQTKGDSSDIYEGQSEITELHLISLIKKIKQSFITMSKISCLPEDIIISTLVAMAC